MPQYDLIILGGGGGRLRRRYPGLRAGVQGTPHQRRPAPGWHLRQRGLRPLQTLAGDGEPVPSPSTSPLPGIRDNRHATFDFGAAIGEKDEIVAALRESNYTRVAAALGIPVIEGRARFISPQRLEVNGQALAAERFIVATGSPPQVPPFPGVEEAGYITSREALSLERLPRSLLVIGGGPLTLEFAQMYSRFGTQVTLLQRSRRLLSREEPEVSWEIKRCLDDEGIQVWTGVSVRRLGREGHLRVVEAEAEGQARHFRAEELLLATGVVPNSADMGLEAAGVETKGGFIQVNPYLQTTAPHIYAAGDVVGKMFLETVAAREGYLAAGNALEGTKKTVDYDSVPRAVFTDPQVASVGLTEEELMRRYHVCSCRTVRIDQVPKARAIKETRGLVKMVVRPETGVIAGVHIVAPMAADLIHEATLAVRFKLTVDDLIDTVHVFPTLSEAIKLAAQAFKRDITKMSCCVE